MQEMRRTGRAGDDVGGQQPAGEEAEQSHRSGGLDFLVTKAELGTGAPPCAGQPAGEVAEQPCRSGGLDFLVAEAELGTGAPPCDRKCRGEHCSSAKKDILNRWRFSL